MSSISYDDIIDAWNKIEKLHKNSDGGDDYCAGHDQMAAEG